MSRLTTALESVGVEYMFCGSVASGSERQLRDAAGIVEVCGSVLDWACLEEWAAELEVGEELEKVRSLPSSAHRVRAELLYRQLDHLADLKKEARPEFLEAARKRDGWRVVETVPGFGPLRAAQFAAWVGTPHRFRSRQQLWAYAGLAVVRRGTGHYDRDLRRVRDPRPRGLNRNHNRHLKHVLKSAAISAASNSPDASWKEAAQHHRDRGLDPALIPVTLARRVGAIALHLWKTGAEYDAKRAFPISRTSTPAMP